MAIDESNRKLSLLPFPTLGARFREALVATYAERQIPSRRWHERCLAGVTYANVAATLGGFLMKAFHCPCGTRLFFDNTRCLTCGREVGFLPDTQTMIALDPSPDGVFETDYGSFRKCANNLEHGVCNWLVNTADAGANEDLCRACRLNHVIPDLNSPENRALWANVEAAKRRLLYGLDALRLPIVDRREDPERGLAFDIKRDETGDRVLTGHADGLITLNLDEADPAKREQIRQSMNERYRTLLGHFRHEIGHYYFDRLIDTDEKRAVFREVFGDERDDYAQALQNHYAAPTTPWHESFISRYAASHPWEDWAETFAHYLHMSDTLDTARNFGVAVENASGAQTAKNDFDELLSAWMNLTVALNALNRSMGLADAYPFALSDPVIRKLALVHDLIGG